MLGIPRRYSHFVYGVIQSGLTSAIAAAIASFPFLADGSFAIHWLRSGLACLARDVANRTFRGTRHSQIDAHFDPGRSIMSKGLAANGFARFLAPHVQRPYL